MTNQEIAFAEVWEILWFRRVLVGATTLFFGISAVTVSLILPEKFSATVTVLPVDDDAGNKLGKAGEFLSQFGGGLSALTGLSLGGGSKAVEALATLKSGGLSEAFIRENNLMPVLFNDKWDASKNDWDVANQSDVPTLWKAEKFFRTDVRDISEDKKTGLVTLTVTWSNPKQAADWANGLVARCNQYLRQKVIAESQKNLEYLKEQLNKTTVVELKSAIYGLSEAEIKKIMIATGNEEYAFRIVDAARPPEERTSPKRMLISLAGVFFGFIIGVALALGLKRRSAP